MSYKFVLFWQPDWVITVLLKNVGHVGQIRCRAHNVRCYPPLHQSFCPATISSIKTLFICSEPKSEDEGTNSIPLHPSLVIHTYHVVVYASTIIWSDQTNDDWAVKSLAQDDTPVLDMTPIYVLHNVINCVMPCL